LNAIILRSGKQLDEPKAIHGEKGECVAKEKSQPAFEDEVIVVPNKEQGIHEGDLRLRVVKPYQPPDPFPNALQRPSLRPNLGNSWKFLKSYKSTSLS